MKGGVESLGFGVRYTWSQVLVLALTNCEISGKLQASLNVCFIDYKMRILWYLPHKVVKIKSGHAYSVPRIVLTLY